MDDEYVEFNKSMEAIDTLPAHEMAVYEPPERSHVQARLPGPAFGRAPCSVEAKTPAGWG